MQDVDFERPSTDEIARLAKFSAATLHEAMGKRGAAASDIKPLAKGMRLCGPAFTVDCVPGDNLAIHLAVASARPGDVLVVGYKGFRESGPFGDVLALAARSRGIAGLAIDGSVRDGDEIDALGFPVFCCGRCVKGTEKNHAGNLASPIVFAGVHILSGDVVVADDDGLVIVPRLHILHVLASAADIEAKEAALRREIVTGRLTIDLLGLRESL